MLVPALLLLLPGQAIRAPANEDAAAMEPPLMRVPGSGDVEVARNAAFLTTEQLSAASLLTFDGATETETPVPLEVVEGLTIARLPLQPALTAVTLRLSFAGGFTEDMSWTTGSALIDGPAAPAVVARAEVVRPLLENPHVEIELAPEPDLAAAVLSAVDGEQRTRLSASMGWGGTSPITFADWAYQGGVRDYDVVAIDRAGNVADATPITVGEGGCAAAPAGAPAALALALLVLGRTTRARARPSLSRRWLR